MKNLFQFKKFDVNQAGCTMKINTDGVLLAVSAQEAGVQRILDIGTGTGVIALMLAQRFPEALVEAIDIDQESYLCALENFGRSPFADRLSVMHTGIGAYETEHCFDLIVSNPPFFINSLKNIQERKTLSRHGSLMFYQEIFEKAQQYLSPEGSFQIIWPIASRDQVLNSELHQSLFIHNELYIRSFPRSEPFRVITTFKRQQSSEYSRSDFPIYQQQGVYTRAYIELLKPFFIKL